MRYSQSSSISPYLQLYPLSLRLTEECATRGIFFSAPLQLYNCWHFQYLNSYPRAVFCSHLQLWHSHKLFGCKKRGNFQGRISENWQTLKDNNLKSVRFWKWGKFCYEIEILVILFKIIACSRKKILQLYSNNLTI